jgi:hypothetical protein
LVVIYNEKSRLICFSRRSAGANSLRIKRQMVGASGFEPEASCAQGRRATRLRYAPTKYVKIIKDFPTELLLHLTNFASNRAK